MFFSAIFKAKARAALRNYWQTALLIALIVNLPTLLVQGIAVFTNSDPLTRAEDLLLKASVSTAAMNALPDSVQAMMTETGVIAMIVLNALAWLITPALSAGMNHWTLERLRGQELPVSAVFSRLRIAVFRCKTEQQFAACQGKRHRNRKVRAVLCFDFNPHGFTPRTRARCRRQHSQL